MNVKYFVLSCALSCGVGTLSLCDMCCNKRTYNILIYGENNHVFWLYDRFVGISVDYNNTEYDKYTQEKVLSVSPVDFHGQSCKHQYADIKRYGMKIRLWAVIGNVDFSIFGQVGGLDGVFVFFEENDDYNKVFENMTNIVSNGRIIKKFFCYQNGQIGNGDDDEEYFKSVDLQGRIKKAYKDAFKLNRTDNLFFSGFAYSIYDELWLFMKSVKENAQKFLKS
ncbi:MAG: hypothetical protein II393_01130 [Cytophagales bacterium]|nr:hypothetical protein [Cytophagales bacterium]